MSTGRRWSIAAAAMLGVSGVATLVRLPHEFPDNTAEERAYAVAIGEIADSAIHRLDFFPSRAQLRIQAAFMLPSDDPVPFDALASRGNAASAAIGLAVDRFTDVRVPDDLRKLNAELVNALKDANNASANLTAAAHVCETMMTSINRCQAPFTSASSRLAASYNRYLGARAKIGAQIVDTDTHLADFKRP
ncbi:MAG TPA: hypothetical protein VGM82_23825 [Gemmatimonadaceae bacterium]|jgi:hypothetical protein